MPATPGEILQSLATIPSLQVTPDAPLAGYTRFGIGGSASILADASSRESLVAALHVAGTSGLPCTLIGGGTNLIVSDTGFHGIVVRYTAAAIRIEGNRVTADAGAELQGLVDLTVEQGLAGLETLARIPGWVGAAVYGNAGAYGHAIAERVAAVDILASGAQRTLSGVQCEFRYRDSVFKRRKDWVVLSAEFLLETGEPVALRKIASDIQVVRDRKFPASMKCAGSIFKNLLVDELPPSVAAQVPEEAIREGKVPAGWFLDRAGARGRSRGGIRVADYHANLVYNAGAGTARDLCGLISELKTLVRDRFGFDLEEEVQYLGFER